MTLDINECSQKIRHHLCAITNGSYLCSCEMLTVLAINGVHYFGILHRIE